MEKFNKKHVLHTAFISFLLIFFSLAGLAALQPMNTRAENVITSGDYKYTLDNNKATIVNYTGTEEKDLIIPATLDGKTIIALAHQAFADKSFTTATIPDSVEKIGDGAFIRCTKLQRVILGQNVTNIEEYAFYNCIQLHYVLIPDSVSTIENYNFGMYGFNNVTPPDLTILYHDNDTAVSYADENNFSKQKIDVAFDFIKDTDGQKIEISGTLGNLANTDVIIPSKIGDSDVTKIKGGAFFQKPMKSVTIQGSVEVIENAAFSLSGLKSVSIESGCQTIEDYAFNGCSNMETVSLPNTMKTIGEYAFGQCDKLNSITIPSSVTQMGEGAFMGCVGLRNVSFLSGSTLSALPEFTFDGCESLNSVLLPSSITNIRNRAFSGCKGLLSISFPANLTNIGNYAFWGCEALSSINFDGESISEIGKGAFCGCTANNSMEIPNTTCNIGLYALGYTASNLDLTAIDPENADYQKRDDFELNVYSNSKALTYADTNGFTYNLLDTSDENAIAKLYNYEVIDTYNVRITKYKGAEKVARVPKTIDNKAVIEITGETFKNNTLLTRIYLSDSITTFDLASLEGCTSLSYISVDSGNNVYYSSNGILYNKEQTELLYCPPAINLSAFEVPDTVTVIRTGAFSGCTSLKSITLHKTLETIGDNSFSGCTGIYLVDFQASSQDWEQITIGEGNEPLTTATIAYSETTSDPGNNNPTQNPDSTPVPASTNPPAGSTPPAESIKPTNTATPPVSATTPAAAPTATPTSPATATNSPQPTQTPAADTQQNSSSTTQTAKKKQPMTVKAVNKTVKASQLKKKNKVLAGAVRIKKNKGTVTYKKISKGSSKALTIAKKTGKITVKKGTKKGTYKIIVKVTAKGNNNYKSGSKTVTVKIKVK